MVEKLARSISFIFHPLWIPTFLFGTIFSFTPSLAGPINQELLPRMLVIIFVLTGIIPLATLFVMRLPYFIMIAKLWVRNLINSDGITRSLVYLRPEISMVKRRSVLQSFKMIHRSERVIPFFVITAFYVAICIMFSGKLGWSSFFIMAMLIISLNSLIVSVVTLFWKISVHSVAISCVVGFLLAAILVRAESALLYPLAGFMVIAGGVMSARLYLNVHTPAQVGWGCLMGFLVSFLASWWYF